MVHCEDVQLGSLDRAQFPRGGHYCYGYDVVCWLRGLWGWYDGVRGLDGEGGCGIYEVSEGGGRDLERGGDSS